MPKINLRYLKSGEWNIIREEDPEAPIEVLATEHLGLDVALSLCNLESKTAALERQVSDKKVLYSIFDELLRHSFKPYSLMVSLVGGAAQKNSPESQRVQAYIFEIMETLEDYASLGSEREAETYMAIHSPSYKQANIQGEHCIFHIIRCDTLENPQPESVYIVPRSRQLDDYTPSIKALFTASAVPIVDAAAAVDPFLEANKSLSVLPSPVGIQKSKKRPATPRNPEQKEEGKIARPRVKKK